MRFYNVIIKDNDDDEYSNRLRFSFDTQQEALSFANKILEISEYDVEIYQCYEEENKE